MALLIHFGERSVFVVAGLLCLWLSYRLLGATSEFSKWSEQATSNAQSAIDILKRAITEANQTLERISEAEKKARSERTDFIQTIERVIRTKLEKIPPDIEASTTEARYWVESQLDRDFQSVDKWKEDLRKTLDEMYGKIVKMEKSMSGNCLENPGSPPQTGRLLISGLGGHRHPAVDFCSLRRVPCLNRYRGEIFGPGGRR
jgi:hypothetical protein